MTKTPPPQTIDNGDGTWSRETKRPKTKDRPMPPEHYMNQPPQTEPKNAPKDVSRLARRSTEVDKPIVPQTEQIEELLTVALGSLMIRHNSNDEYPNVGQIIEVVLPILTASNRKLLAILLKAFEAKAYFMVGDFSGSEPHPQLQKELMDDFVQLVKTHIKDPDIPAWRPLDKYVQEIEAELKKLGNL